MREVSESEFMRFAVRETDTLLYQSWTDGVFAGSLNMDMVLVNTALKLFAEQDRGNVVDYVAGIVVAKLNGTLKWIT